MNVPEPTREHRWLQTLVGDWTWETEPVVGHEYPTHRGSETGRAIGGFWLELAGDGGHGPTRVTLGFDPDRGRFVGTWVGGMAPVLWLYDGQLEVDGKTLVLSSNGPSMEGEGLTNYRDIVEVVSPHERTLRAEYADKNGTWVHFMTTRYRRVR